LPKNLYELDLGGEFNKELPELPESLKILSIGGAFEKEIGKNMLPKGLKEFHFRDRRIKNPRFLLPDGLEVLTLSCGCGHKKIEKGFLPKSLKKLRLLYYGYPLKEKGALPKGLIELDLGHTFHQTITYLPKSLKNLTLPNNYEKTKISVLDLETLEYEIIGVSKKYNI
jgi:hypothetical protein